MLGYVCNIRLALVAIAIAATVAVGVSRENVYGLEILNQIDELALLLIYNEKMGKEKEIEIVTTLRQNALLGYVSKESPLGSAVMGKKVGDRVLVEVNPTMSYYVEIRKITKGEDNTEIPISGF